MPNLYLFITIAPFQRKYAVKKHDKSKKSLAKNDKTLWRREGDSNPWYGDYRTHDFQSCSFGQLGHLSKDNDYYIKYKSENQDFFQIY